MHWLFDPGTSRDPASFWFGFSRWIDTMSCEYSREEFKRDQLGQTGTDLSKLSERKPGPQEDCEACIAQRVHTAAETHMFHPFATHGYTKEQGYTDTRLKRFADERAAAAEKAKNAAATKK